MTKRMARTSNFGQSPDAKRRKRLRELGVRSGLEKSVCDYLHKQGVSFEYEAHPLFYTVPERRARYTPDLFLPNGIIIETKGRFVTSDRQKMKLIKEQHPDLDIRFVFSRSSTRISKLSKTTYGMWALRHGFPYADALPPTDWLKEPPNMASIAALQEITNAKT